MTTAREARDSEKTLSNIWALLPHLQVTVWHPIEEDAIEHATEIMLLTGKLIEQLKEQKREKENAQYKNMDKRILEPQEMRKDLHD